MFLLDTNFVSELRRPDRADPNVLAWATATLPDYIFISSITILELEIGTLRMEREDVVFGKALRDWLDSVLLDFRHGTLSFDTAAARACAALHVPDPRSERDAQIAAIAIVHGLTVVTRNVGDFAPLGVKLFNPWQ
jgi:toxin FitB